MLASILFAALPLLTGEWLWLLVDCTVHRVIGVDAPVDRVGKERPVRKGRVRA